jgi:tetratricopeptide (TPR) repeat protein
MSEAFQRGLLLLGQNRNDLAAEQFGRHLATEPNDAYAHGLLAMCLADSEKYGDATHHAGEAVRLAPDFPFAHYSLAYVLTERERFDEALLAINEAVRLDPDDADHFSLLSRIYLCKSNHQEALNAADQGLQVDAEHVGCQNLRAMALKNLGRHSDAAEALEGALARDPENAVTHANKGWALLEKNQSEEALKHFQEALRIDPTLDWAREGIVTALKARYKIYGVMLKYFLFMGKLSQQQQWMVILGVYFGSRVLRSVSKSQPHLAPILEPVRMLLFAFVILTWLADPLFNLALRMNPYGRLALNEDQQKSSTLVGLCVVVAAFCVAAGLVFGFSMPLLAATAGIGLLAMPLSAIFNCRPGTPRRLMALYATVMALALAAGVTFAWLSADGKGGHTGPFEAPMMIAGAIYVIGLFGVSWVANLLMMWREKK